MGVDICADCQECLFDYWVQCESYTEVLGNHNGRVCSDCFSEDEYDKYKLYYYPNESVDFTFNLCPCCTENHNIDDLYERVTNNLVAKTFSLSEVTKYLKLNDFEKLIEKHRNEYYSTSPKNKEILKQIEINEKEISILQNKIIELQSL